MGFGEAISTCMGKYATFSGRATRSEFWWFYLFSLLMGWGATLVGYAIFQDNFLMAELLPNIISLALLVPSMAAGSRRLHDIGKSGWWQLLILTVIGIILLIVWWATATKPEDTKYGLPSATHQPIGGEQTGD